jgi:hypothetical protein
MNHYRAFTIGNVVRCALMSLAVAACGTSDASGQADDIKPSDGASPSDAKGPSSDMAPVTMTCPTGLPRLTDDVSMTVSSSSAGGGNPQRDYCMILGTGATAVRLELSGGQCYAGGCLGDDLHLYLKAGAVPDGFEPDSSTTEWTYTPGDGAYGTYTKPGSAGVYFLSLLDDANTLGYSDVTMTLRR